MYKLLLLPDADGYNSSEPQSEWIHTELDGGVGRYRRDKIGGSRTVQVRWTMNPQQYEYWRTFFAVVGSSTFLCDLVSEDGTGPKEHEVNFVPGSVALTGQQGLTYIQAATLEVKPRARNAELDIAFILLYEQSNGDIQGILDGLAKLATVTIPNAEAFQ